LRLLLTGGTGFLGKNVARRLAAAGHSLRVLARASSRLEGLPTDAEIVRGDVVDLESLRAAAAGCDAVLHLAAMVKMWTTDRSVFDRVNVDGLRNVLDAAERAGARVVYTSSFMALGPSGPAPGDESLVHPGRPRNDYERTKAEADRVAREAAASGRDIVILYPGVVYGPGDLTDGNIVVKMVSDHLAGRFPGIVGPGDRLWSYSYVSDVVDGHLAALERGRAGERYILAGENVPMDGLFETLHLVSGKRPPRLHIPYPVAAALGYACVGWAELTGHPPLLTHEVVGVFREHWAYSSAKAEQQLGYRSRPLRDGLEATVAWLKDPCR
jgi:NAD+-dependent farnesol dehydrogenase